ncbi:MAG: branched-chain amino acid aminotransferase, partial [Kordiimonadaceae bacterium]|nr:branched-chain amino acid aminotransferase [Kordiimonadaceae bacterium]
MSTPGFDDRDGVIWYNGKLIDWRDANFHVLSHALHYASSVFEGQRAYGGKIFKLHEHSERLINSGKILGFDVPYSAEQLDAAADEVVKANGLLDAYVRPVAWRGSEMMGVATKGSKIHVAIAAWEWPSYFGQEAKLKGLNLEIAKWARPAPNTAPTASKAAGLYMIASLCKDAATENGFDDALMLDYRGQVAEATGANIFFLKDGELHTPIPDCF